MKDCRIQQIYNGIDINVFKPQMDTKAITGKYDIPLGKRVLLGVASNWWRKGFEDFLQLRRLLDDKYVIVLVGLDEKRIKSLHQTYRKCNRLVWTLFFGRRLFESYLGG